MNMNADTTVGTTVTKIYTEADHQTNKRGLEHNCPARCAAGRWCSHAEEGGAVLPSNNIIYRALQHWYQV